MRRFWLVNSRDSKPKIHETKHHDGLFCCLLKLLKFCCYFTISDSEPIQSYFHSHTSLRTWVKIKIISRLRWLVESGLILITRLSCASVVICHGSWVMGPISSSWISSQGNTQPFFSTNIPNPWSLEPQSEVRILWSCGMGSDIFRFCFPLRVACRTTELCPGGKLWPMRPLWLLLLLSCLSKVQLRMCIVLATWTRFGF